MAKGAAHPSLAGLTPAQQTTALSMVNAWLAGETWSPDRLKRPGEGPSPPNEVEAATIRKALMVYLARERGAVDAKSADPMEVAGPVSVGAQGANLENAAINGMLDLSGLHFPLRLRFSRCRFRAPVILDNAKLGALTLSRCRFPWLRADATQFDGPVLVTDCMALAVHLRGARVQGLVNLGGTLLVLDLLNQVDRMAEALIGERLQLSSETTIEHTSQTLWAAALIQTVEGSPDAQLLPRALSLIERMDPALIATAQLARLFKPSGDVSLSELHAATTRLAIKEWADAGRQVLTSVIADKDGLTPTVSPLPEGEFEGTLWGQPYNAVMLDAATISADLFLRNGYVAFGESNLIRSEIGGRLDCSAGKFFVTMDVDRRPDPSIVWDCALNFSSAHIGDDVLLHQSVATLGSCDCITSEIGGDLVADGVFFAPGGRALNLNGSEFSSDVMTVASFSMSGAMSLNGTVVRGNVFLSGTMSTASGNCVVMESVEIGDSVRLIELTCEGGFNAIRATIAGNFFIRQPSLLGVKGRPALDLRTATIGQSLSLSNFKAFSGDLDLRDVRARSFADDGSGWRQEPETPPMSRLMALFSPLFSGGRPVAKVRDTVRVRLAGFTYDQFVDSYGAGQRGGGGKTLLECVDRIAWLSAQHPDDLNPLQPQPWTQCARILRKMGNVRDANLIMFACETMRGAQVQHRVEWAFTYLLGLTAGYGFKTYRAALQALFIILAGALFYWIANSNGYLGRAPETVVASIGTVKVGGQEVQAEMRKQALADPEFHALAYSLDVFVPLVDLRQAVYWVPVQPVPSGTVTTKVSHEDASDPPVTLVSDFVRSVGAGSRPAGWMAEEADGALTQFLAAVKRLTGIGTWLWALWMWTWFQIIAGWWLTTVAVAGVTGLLERREP
jgi:hypothetical protein